MSYLGLQSKCVAGFTLNLFSFETKVLSIFAFWCPSGFKWLPATVPVAAWWEDVNLSEMTSFSVGEEDPTLVFSLPTPLESFRSFYIQTIELHHADVSVCTCPQGPTWRGAAQLGGRSESCYSGWSLWCRSGQFSQTPRVGEEGDSVNHGQRGP